MHQYDEFLADDSGNVILGAGLAIDGASRRLDGKTSAVIDSGIIVILTALGIGFGTILILALAFSVAISFSRFAGRSPPIVGYRAIALASFCQLPFGAIFVGGSEFLTWLFLGLAAASAHLGRQAERSTMRGKDLLLARSTVAAFPKGALSGV